ncbi:hypothetical protein BYT27DRAFT_6488298 [Phlegmacium glaucopus]|nr:hypothetical protein BYT27DRAFT_6488298 [Phlegmacium glaucopus]
MASFSPVFASAVRATFPAFCRVFRRHYDSCWLEFESSSTFSSHHLAPHLFLSSQFSFFLNSTGPPLWSCLLCRTACCSTVRRDGCDHGIKDNVNLDFFSIPVAANKPSTPWVSPDHARASFSVLSTVLLLPIIPWTSFSPHLTPTSYSLQIRARISCYIASRITN